MDANSPEIPSLDQAEVLKPTHFSAYNEGQRVSFIKPYDPKAPSLQGFSVAKIQYRVTEKQKEKGTVAKPTQMVYYPSLTIPQDWKIPEDVASLFLDLCQDEVVEIIRAKIEDKAATIHWDILTLDKVISSLKAVQASKKFTSASLEAWATAALVPFCEGRAKALCEANNVTDEAKCKEQFARTLNAYKDRIVKLAAPVPNLGTEDCNALLKMFEVAALADPIADALVAKIKIMLQPKVLKDVTDL